MKCAIGEVQHPKVTFMVHLNHHHVLQRFSEHILLLLVITWKNIEQILKKKLSPNKVSIPQQVTNKS